MREPGDLPEFVREALAEESGADAEPLLRLPELLDPVPAAPGLARLLEAVAEPPARFAPFIARLAALWDLSETAACAVLERTRDPRAFRRTALPGARRMEVSGGPKTIGANVGLVRFEPGLRFPRHRHRGREVTLVLQGSYTDSQGRLVGPGDFHEMQQGTEHALRVSRGEACIVAAVHEGFDFRGPILGTLSKLFGS